MGNSRADTLMFVGGLLSILGAFFLFSRPAANPQVLLFRLGLITIGAVLGGVGLVMKLSAPRKDHDDE